MKNKESEDYDENDTIKNNSMRMDLEENIQNIFLNPHTKTKNLELRKSLLEWTYKSEEQKVISEDSSTEVYDENKTIQEKEQKLMSEDS